MSLSQCWAVVTVCPSLQVIFSACELGVFDLLLKSQEPLSAQHVAQELSTSVDGMERLLDALVGVEILEVETAKGTGKKEEVISWDWPDYQMLNVMLITNKPKKSGSKQRCTAAPTWQTFTWPKAAPSLFTTWSSTNPRPSTLCGTTWWTPSGWWLQLGEGRTTFLFHVPSNRDQLKRAFNGSRQAVLIMSLFKVSSNMLSFLKFWDWTLIPYHTYSLSE